MWKKDRKPRGLWAWRGMGANISIYLYICIRMEVKNIPICLIRKMCLLEEHSVRCHQKRNHTVCRERKSYWTGENKRGKFGGFVSGGTEYKQCRHVMPSYGKWTPSHHKLDLLGLRDALTPGPCASLPASFKASFTVCFFPTLSPGSSPAVSRLEDPKGSSSLWGKFFPHQIQMLSCETGQV